MPTDRHSLARIPAAKKAGWEYAESCADANTVHVENYIEAIKFPYDPPILVKGPKLLKFSKPS